MPTLSFTLILLWNSSTQSCSTFLLGCGILYYQFLMATVSMRSVHRSNNIIPKSMNQETQLSGIVIIDWELYSLSFLLLFLWVSLSTSSLSHLQEWGKKIANESELFTRPWYEFSHFVISSNHLLTSIFSRMNHI